jgi:hypothetical protein
MIYGSNNKSFDAAKKFNLDATNNSWNSANASAAGDPKTVYALQCLEETTFTTLVDKTFTTTPNSTDTGSALTAGTYPAGFILYGEFSQIVVNTGAVQCYSLYLVQ